MAKHSSKRFLRRKRQRASYSRKRRWLLERLEAKRLLACDLAAPMDVDVEEQPAIVLDMTQESSTDPDAGADDRLNGQEPRDDVAGAGDDDEVDEELADDLEEDDDDELEDDLEEDGEEEEDGDETGDTDDEDDDADEDDADDDDADEEEADEDDGEEGEELDDEGDEELEEGLDEEDGGEEEPDEEEPADEEELEDEEEAGDDDDDGDLAGEEEEDPDDEEDLDGEEDDAEEEDEGEDEPEEGDEADGDTDDDADDSGEGGGQPISTTPLHESVMALVSSDLATNTVTQSGDWSRPETWSNNQVPSANARIVIPQGVTLTVDSVMPQEFKTIRVEGTLNFATDRNTELRVDTLVTTRTGRLEIGTAANPIAPDVVARVVFIDDGAIDRSADPAQVGRGAILMGETEIHGAAATHQLALAVHPTAGATTLELNAVPVGWKVGDEVVVTGTQGPTSDEVRTISALNGSSITLSAPLGQDHVPPRSDLNVYVANTTRNVEFTSENTATARRGHVMFMHTNNATVRNAKFTELGRTDKKIPLDDFNFEFPEEAVGNRTSAGVVFNVTAGAGNNVRGRYPVHFHRGGTTPGSAPATVDGNVIVGSPGYGYVNHSANVNITNNVSYNVHGSAYYTEAGDEIGSIANNIAIRTVNPDFRLEENGEISVDLRADVQDFGVDGDAFWLSGHLVSLTNNIASGASGHGLIIWSDGLVEPDRGRTTVRTADIANGDLIPNRETIPVWWAPLAEVSNNEASNATIGFRARYIHSSTYLGDVGSPFHEPPPQAYLDTLQPVIDGLIVWGSRDGALLNYNERLSLKNARMIGIGAPYVRQGGTTDLGVGIDMHNDVSRGPGVVENVTVEGFNMGILAPRHESWQMSNIHLRNTTDLFVQQANLAARRLDLNNVTFGELAGTAVAGNEAQRRNVVMEGEFTGEQPYWFLMTDEVTWNGEGLYYNEQAANHVTLTEELHADSRAPVPTEFIGLTNQQLQDRYGTSFGGEITPADARSAPWLTGGVIGRPASPGQTNPPLYEMRDADTFDVVDSGNLTNFAAPPATGNAVGFGAAPQAAARVAVQAGNVEAPVRPTDVVEDPALELAQLQMRERNFDATDGIFADGDFEEDDEDLGDLQRLLTLPLSSD